MKYFPAFGKHRHNSWHFRQFLFLFWLLIQHAAEGPILNPVMVAQWRRSVHLNKMNQKICAMIDNEINNRICFQQNIYNSIFRCSAGSFDRSETRASTFLSSFSSAMMFLMQHKKFLLFQSIIYFYFLSYDHQFHSSFSWFWCHTRVGTFLKQISVQFLQYSMQNMICMKCGVPHPSDNESLSVVLVYILVRIMWLQFYRPKTNLK